MKSNEDYKGEAGERKGGLIFSFRLCYTKIMFSNNRTSETRRLTEGNKTLPVYIRNWV